MQNFNHFWEKSNQIGEREREKEDRESESPMWCHLAPQWRHVGPPLLLGLQTLQAPEVHTIKPNM